MGPFHFCYSHTPFQPTFVHSDSWFTLVEHVLVGPVANEPPPPLNNANINTPNQDFCWDNFTELFIVLHEHSSDWTHFLIVIRTCLGKISCRDSFIDSFHPSPQKHSDYIIQRPESKPIPTETKPVGRIGHHLPLYCTKTEERIGRQFLVVQFLSNCSCRTKYLQDPNFTIVVSCVFAAPVLVPPRWFYWMCKINEPYKILFNFNSNVLRLLMNLSRPTRLIVLYQHRFPSTFLFPEIKSNFSNQHSVRQLYMLGKQQIGDNNTILWFRVLPDFKLDVNPGRVHSARRPVPNLGVGIILRAGCSFSAWKHPDL